MFKKLKEKKQTVIAYQDVFGSENGKRVLFDLMKSTHFFDTTMDPNPHELAYNEGARSVVLRILKTINTDPSQLEMMIKMDNQRSE
jgi:hypothetical protein